MKTQETTKQDDLLNELRQFSGTEGWHKLTFLPVLCTDGVKYLADRAGAYWLVDAIASYLPNVRRTGDRMAVCKLKKIAKSWLLTLEAGEKTIKQKIEYSDFPLEEITLYLCDNGFSWCLLLPSEY